MIDFDNYTNCAQCKDKCIAQFINDDDIPLLNDNKSNIYYPAGQIIAKQSSFSSKIIYILSGLVKILKEGKNGKNTLIKVIEENNFLAIPIHENHKKYTFSAFAITDTEICEINESGIHNLVLKSQKLADYLLDIYYDDQLYLMNRIHLLNTRNNHGKLSASLIYLNNFNRPDVPVFDFITRKDLAELSSISIESVNKILQELKNDRIIDINNKGIQIIRLDLIEKLSKIG